MPPKGWRKYADGFKPANSSGVPSEERPVYGLEDLLLPRASISKLAKGVLPDKTALPKDGVTALQRSATVFISYLASEANRAAHKAGRVTVLPSDVLAALEGAHLGSFVGQVQALAETMQEQAAARKKIGVSEQDGDAAGEDADMEDAPNSSPAAADDPDDQTDAADITDAGEAMIE